MTTATASTYATIAGDTWDVIALRTLGSERYVPQLMDANPAHAWTFRFKAGVTLVVPTLATEAASTLPPWRRSA